MAQLNVITQAKKFIEVRADNAHTKQLYEQQQQKTHK